MVLLLVFVKEVTHVAVIFTKNAAAVFTILLSLGEKTFTREKNHKYLNILTVFRSQFECLAQQDWKKKANPNKPTKYSSVLSRKKAY